MDFANDHDISGPAPVSFDHADNPEKAMANKDEDDVNRMGYTAEIPRKFTLLSLFAIGYEICVAPVALMVSLSVSIGSGGPATLVWGQLIIYFMALCIVISLAELASAYPNAGGQYYWAAMLAPKPIRRMSSFVVGYISWASAIFGCASSLIAVSQMTVSLVVLRHGDVTEHPWMVFITYQGFNLVMMIFNVWEAVLPKMSRFFLVISISTPLIIIIAILARSEQKQSATFVFTGFTNLAGWNDGIAFLTGLLGVNWGFSGLDGVTHMSEEIPDPRRNVPRALLATVIVGAVLSWPTAIALLFCVQDIEKVVDTSTGLPSLELFFQVFDGTFPGPVGLQTLLLVTSLGAVFGIQTWQSRLAWSLARDDALPFSKIIRRIAPAPYSVPLWAHVWSSLFVAILGCLYLGSEVAFNSFVSGGILMQYCAYSICIIFMLYKGRSKIPRGPFWLGKWGLFCNIMTLFWTVFSLVFYCFPPYFPITPTTMNYVSVVIVAFSCLFLAYYYAYGRKAFTGPPQTE